MSEHTQGGWCAGGAHLDGAWVYTESGGDVAWVPAGFSSNSAASVSAEEAHKRAMLIAAAPDLLVALQALCDAAEYGDVLSWSADWDVARAAINKAKGIKT